MTDTTTPTSDLDLQVIAGDYALAGNQPANYTLIKGERQSVLVDVPFARSDAHRVIAAILNSGTELRTIYITHDHPDHFFTLDLFSDTFPDTEIVAQATVVKDMERSIPLKFDRWAADMGANAPRRGVVPEALADDKIELEGHTLEVVGPMQGDHIHGTALWDSGSRTLVAGDLMFNGVFLFLGEHRPPQYDAWLGSLDYLESLNPIRIIAGHSKPGLPDDSFAIDWSRRYLHEFKQAARSATSAMEMAAQLHAAYPNAVGFPGTDFLVEVSSQVATGEIEPWDE